MGNETNILVKNHVKFKNLAGLINSVRVVYNNHNFAPII